MTDEILKKVWFALGERSKLKVILENFGISRDDYRAFHHQIMNPYLIKDKSKKKRLEELILVEHLNDMEGSNSRRVPVNSSGGGKEYTNKELTQEDIRYFEKYLPQDPMWKSSLNLLTGYTKATGQLENDYKRFYSLLARFLDQSPNFTSFDREKHHTKRNINGVKRPCFFIERKKKKSKSKVIFK